MKPVARLLHLAWFYFSLLGLGLHSVVALAAADPIKIADGRPWTIQEFGMTITPPKSWQILPNYRGKALVLQPIPHQEKIKDYNKPIYNRNLTIAVTHKPAPIDEAQAQILRTKLELDFGQAVGVSDFQIIEHRFIDYREKADGILIYTAFNLNGYPMSQMHIFVSGVKEAVLLTYTDLAESFQANEDAMTLAWNAMLSIDVMGHAPRRYEDVLYLGAGAGLVLLAACCSILLRRRGAHRIYESEEDRLYRDDAVDAAERSAATSLGTAVAQTPVADDDEEQQPPMSSVWNLATSAVSTAVPRKVKAHAGGSRHDSY